MTGCGRFLQWGGGKATRDASARELPNGILKIKGHIPLGRHERLMLSAVEHWMKQRVRLLALFAAGQGSGRPRKP